MFIIYFFFVYKFKMFYQVLHITDDVIKNLWIIHEENK